MLKLTSAIKKETLFLLRDIPGLAILFVMPLLLVLVVTLAQDQASSSSRKAPLLIIDEANTPLSRLIVNEIDRSGLFRITCKQRTTNTEQRKSNLTLRLAPSDSSITIIVDPAVTLAEKRAWGSSLAFIIKGAEAKQVMENTLDKMFIASDTTMKMMVRSALAQGMAAMPSINERYDLPEKSEIRPSVVQNNVPGFILFAMFFIVIPLSASMISEKNEGAWTRLKTLPVPGGILLGSKVVVYLGVCLVQFLLMMCMGIWLFPWLFGLEPLHIGHRYAAIVLVTVTSSLSAIGFGILTGAFARTMGQAALFGSVMVVILGLISGTFLPIHLMPAAIQYISLVSPVRWGIDSYLMIFIREAGIKEILHWVILSFLFFSLAMIISIYIFAKRK